MSTSTINLLASMNGTPIDIGTVVLSDRDGVYGVKRLDTDDVVVTAADPMTEIAVGEYYISFPDPEEGLTYAYSIHINYNGEDYYYNRTMNSGTTVNHIFSVPTTDYYTSEAEVMRIIGEQGVQATLEDWESLDTKPVWDQILSSVDQAIEPYVHQFYSRDAIISNPLIRTHATWIGAHYLTLRRGNPGLYQHQVEKTEDFLSQIRTGQFHIPNARPLGRRAPIVRNYKMQASGMSPYSPSRVIMSKSMGSAPVAGKLAFEPFFGRW